MPHELVEQLVSKRLPPVKNAPFTLWRGKIIGALFMPALAMVGVALPLGFVNQVDGYLKYIRPIELPTVYAWGWIIFGLVGLVIGLATIVPVMGTARLLRRSPTDWATRVGAWLALSIMALAVLKGTKSWLQANEFQLAYWMAQFRWELGMVVAAGCAAWVWQRGKLPAGLQSLAAFGAIAGLVPLLVAALTAFAHAIPPIPSAATAPIASTVKRPNIILLTVDTLAADHMSLYGYARPTTPYLERLGRQASVFERFYANSNFTTTSVNSIIHGLRPWSSRVIHLAGQIDTNIADGNLAARLKKTGYQTFAVANNIAAAPSHVGVAPWIDRVAYRRANRYWPLLPDSVAVPYYALLSQQIGVLLNFVEVTDLFLFHVGVVSSAADHHDPEVALSTARDFVGHRDPGRPFFLWVHLYPPHSPYATPPPFIGRFDSRPQARTRVDSGPPRQFDARTAVNFPDRLVGRYDEAIVYLDHHVGRFADWLNAVGLLDDSLLVITADHGESFVKGYGFHAGPMLHDALIHVPLIVKEPAQRVGRRLDVLAEQIDLMPTILDLVGIPIEGAGEGRSLKPALRGVGMAGAVFSMNFEQSNRYGELDTGSVAMIDGRWKYVHYRGQHKYSNLPKLEESLYDLKRDPGEETNLISLHPQIAAEMLTKIQAQLRQHGGPVK